jgi:hypothetical protein
MHQEKPWVEGWGKPNLMCNAKEKMSKAILKDENDCWAKSQSPKPRSTQDFN